MGTSRGLACTRDGMASRPKTAEYVRMIRALLAGSARCSPVCTGFDVARVRDAVSAARTPSCLHWAARWVGDVTGTHETRAGKDTL